MTLNIENVGLGRRYDHSIEEFDKITHGHAERVTLGNYKANGRPYEVIAYKLADKNQEPSEGLIKVLLIAGIHGDEDDAIIGLHKTTKTLIEEDTKRKGYEIWIVPLASPDTVDRGERYNGKGDINRQFFKELEQKAPQVTILENKIIELCKGPYFLMVDGHVDNRYEGAYILSYGNPISNLIAQYGIRSIKDSGVAITKHSIDGYPNIGGIVPGYNIIYPGALALPTEYTKQTYNLTHASIVVEIYNPNSDAGFKNAFLGMLEAFRRFSESKKSGTLTSKDNHFETNLLQPQTGIWNI